MTKANQRLLNKETNFAFIDSQNLFLAIKKQKWKLDFKRFRRYLKDKYKITKAYLFLGYLEKYKKLYNYLDDSGFDLIFKPVQTFRNGKIKGNVDAELVLQTMIEFNNFDQAIIISNDGDFYCLIKYLLEKKKLLKIMVSDNKNYSRLLRKFKQNMVFIGEFQSKVKRRGINLRTKP